MDTTEDLSVEQIPQVAIDSCSKENTELSTGEQRSSDLVFVSSNKENSEESGGAIDKESGDDASSDCLAIEPNPDDETTEEKTIENQNSPEIVETCDSLGKERDQEIVLLDDSEESVVDPKVPPLKLKSLKGPLPELVPIEQSPTTPESGGGRSVRQAALISAEKTKLLSRVERFSASATSEKPMKFPTELNNDDSVSVEKRPGVNIEHCQQCKKFDSCNFQTTSQYGQTGLQFCSKSCAKNYFKSKQVCFINAKESDEKSVEEELPELSDSLCDMVVEPDIEIHTFPDDFQIDCDGGDLCTSPYTNGGISSSNSVDNVIETAIRETLCCFSCNSLLIDVTDAFIWEALEFCSEKCLRTQIQVMGSHCNSCSSKVSEQVLGKLCVRFGAVIRQFCSSECLEKFKARHKLCSQCQINMLNKEQLFCSKTCEDLSQRLKNTFDYMGQRFCAVCKQYKTVCEEVILEGLSNWLCSKPCRNAFRFAHKVGVAHKLDCSSTCHFIHLSSNRCI